ncbi:MAG: glycosyltransferase [Ignavibacteriae bacterium]|nr:glycosyltransferase [Ignavibacteriota bacterium]
MKISGFSFVRNAIRYDYPFVESISSILPLCDEFIIAVGDSQDGTLERLRAINSPKLKIIETIWNESLRVGGQILAQETNVALDHVTGDWAFYLQADEVVHEDDLPNIESAMKQHAEDRRVEGLLFRYRHFYGSYEFVGASRRWYRNEVRIVRPGIGVRSWGDAQGFRIDGRKLRVRPLDAAINHYGWVKSPEKQQAKQLSFNKYWHSDEWVKKNVGSDNAYDYSEGGMLTRFTGRHPAVMMDRVANQNWTFDYDPATVRVPLKEKLLSLVESSIGWRVGEYRNYELI